MTPVYTLPGGAKIGPNSPFILVRQMQRPVHYPPGWLLTATDETLATKSITRTVRFVMPDGDVVDGDTAFDVDREVVSETPAEEEGAPPIRTTEIVTDHYASGWLSSASAEALAGLGIRKRVTYSLPGDRLLDPEMGFSLGETVAEQDAVQYPAGWLALASDSDLAAHGITKEMPAPAKADLRSAAAAKRKAIIDAGCVVDVDGTPTPVWADAQAQASLTGAVVAAQALGAGFSTIWKGRDGAFYPQDATSIVALAMGVMGFVAAAFAVEAQVVAAIEAETVTTLAEVDGAGWPANS